MTTSLHHVFICTTCKQEQVQIGQPFYHNIKQQLTQHPTLQAQVVLHEASCIGDCQSPCNVAFQAEGKGGLLLNGFMPEDTEGLFHYLQSYTSHPLGRVYYAELPEALQKHYKFRIPPLPKA